MGQPKPEQDPQQTQVGGGVEDFGGGVSAKSLVGKQGEGRSRPPRECSTGWGSQNLGRAHSRRRWVGGGSLSSHLRGTKGGRGGAAPKGVLNWVGQPKPGQDPQQAEVGGLILFGVDFAKLDGNGVCGGCTTHTASCYTHGTLTTNTVCTLRFAVPSAHLVLVRTRRCGCMQCCARVGHKRLCAKCVPPQNVCFTQLTQTFCGSVGAVVRGVVQE